MPLETHSSTGRGRLSRVKAPTLIIMGTKDPDSPDPIAEEKYLAQQAEGTLELMKGTGHYPQTEMPDKTAHLVIDFLKQSEVSSWIK